MNIEEMKAKRNMYIKERAEIVEGKNRITVAEERRYNWLGKAIAVLLQEIRGIEPSYLRQGRRCIGHFKYSSKDCKQCKGSGKCLEVTLDRIEKEKRQDETKK